MQSRQRPPRGFFIIWGSRNRIVSDGSGSIQANCPSCNRMTRLEGMKVQRYFTLYFIPLFPSGSAVRFTQCSACKTQFRANLDEMRQMLGSRSGAGGDGGPPPLPGAGGQAGGVVPTFPAAIALYNSMRETPGDSAKLARLLQMYLDMNEPREAVSAGRAYPQAMEISDTCCTLMSQAFLRLGEREAAARHAAAALALNPSNGKALALQGQAT